MKLSSPSFTAPLTALVSAVFAVAALAQTPAAQQPPAEEAIIITRNQRRPTCKVLPKTMTGEQVHELMHKWEASLGAECSTCHAADPNNIGPNGKPRLNFADDSKPEKNTARLMYRMVQDINGNYVEQGGELGCAGELRDMPSRASRSADLHAAEGRPRP